MTAEFAQILTPSASHDAGSQIQDQPRQGSSRSATIVREAPYSQRWSFLADSAIISVAGTPNLSVISAVSIGGALYLLRSDGLPIWPEPFELDYEGWATAVSADGSTVAAGTARKNPAGGTVWILNQFRDVRAMIPLAAPVWSMALSRGGDRLALTTWDNKAMLFAQDGIGFQQVHECHIPHARGLYGIDLDAESMTTFVAAYGVGLIEIGDEWRQQSVIFEHDAGCYNVCFAGKSRESVIGLSDGSFAIAGRGGAPVRRRLTDRPLCGIAATADAEIVFAGSFDGNVYATTRSGDVLWAHETDGEVWSVAASAGGQNVCVGSGDHTVRVLANHVDAAAIAEVKAAEEAFVTAQADQLEPTLSHLSQLYLAYSLTTYGSSRLRALAVSGPDRQVAGEMLLEMLTKEVRVYPGHYQAHYSLGELLYERGRADDAIPHFQAAAEAPRLRNRALRRSAECLSISGNHRAASAVWRRARDSHLDRDARQVVYNLARSYEEQRQWARAIRHYEVLAAWDAGYRDSWDRLTELRARGHADEALPPGEGVLDGVEFQANLLGPDTPHEHEVAASLLPVIQARTAELVVQPGERTLLEDALAIVSRSSARPAMTAALKYDEVLLTWYDMGLPPEDAAKKLLETVHLLSYLTERAAGSRSLDVGSATGRYPMLFAALGVQATGVDIARDAIRYARTRADDDTTRPEFVLGDARTLPFEDESFDWVTCMMGTFAHVPREDHPAVLAEALRVLRPGGLYLLSTWDVECPHLGYLSMYSESQKEIIHRNSRTREETSDLFAAAGFRDTDTRPFCMMPPSTVHDLGISDLTEEDAKLSVYLDIAARAVFSGRHGEMFLVKGKRPE